MSPMAYTKKNLCDQSLYERVYEVTKRLELMSSILKKQKYV